MSNQNISSSVPYVIKTSGDITVYVRGECMTVAKDHSNYSKVVDALKRGNATASEIDGLINEVKNKLVDYTKGSDVTIKDGQVYYLGYVINNSLSRRILTMMAEGFKFDHMVAFLSNLLKNPSNRALNELYTFLENSGLPITDDGHFIAYKAVKADYFDIYTGKTYKNTVGSTIEMPRVMVDERYEHDCSIGLHCGALNYVTGYGHFSLGSKLTEGVSNRLLLVKVNPADVVSVPKYEGHPKIRVCKYVVVDEIKDVVRELAKTVVSSTAKEIAPDRVVTTPVSPKQDVAEDWDNYARGYELGVNDSDNEYRYGANRDFSLLGAYKQGYNDGYNGRDYNDPTEGDNDVNLTATDADESVAEDLCDLPETVVRHASNRAVIRFDDSDWNNYALGWNHAQEDLSNGHRYGSSRDYGLLGDYLKGYNDSFNHRDYNDPNADVEFGSDEDSEECCCECCGDGSSCCPRPDLDECSDDEDPADRAEYQAGYQVGYDDADDGEEYEASLELDDSPEFKRGYRDGYNDRGFLSKFNR